MKEIIQKTALRLPKELHESIHAAAKESGRTMNAEIVYRLQQSFGVKEDKIAETSIEHVKKAENELAPRYLNKETASLINLVQQLIDNIYQQETPEARKARLKQEQLEEREAMLAQDPALSNDQSSPKDKLT